MVGRMISAESPDQLAFRFGIGEVDQVKDRDADNVTGDLGHPVQARRSSAAKINALVAVAMPAGVLPHYAQTPGGFGPYKRSRKA